MASKFDKDALKKNLFWILLGVFAVLWLAGVGIAVMPGDDKAAKDYDKDKKDVESTKGKGVKTSAYQEPWKAHGTKFRDYKDVIWKKAWLQQADMYEWPASMPEAARPLYPEDPFARDAAGSKNVPEDLNIRNRFRDWYHEQFEYLAGIVAPAKFNGGFAAVFPEQTWVKGSAPTQEEIWLAQEDFWVKREILWLIRQAIDAVALFHEVPAPKGEKPPAGAAARHVLRNANWELNLVLVKPATGRGLLIGPDSTIKNINVDERTQVLANSAATSGLPFRFQQPQTRAYHEIRISGEPLPFGKAGPICPLDKDGKRTPISAGPVDLSKPFVVEQILDWELSPVRRIDTIAVAHHSHRTVTGGLKPNPVLKGLEPVEKPEAAAEDASNPSNRPNGMGSGGPPGMMRSGGPMGMSGAPKGQGEGSSEADVTTINKIPRDRYLHVTPQARHLPIALRMVVDQAHIHDILASISNSRLRMQITQVSFHHVTDVTRASVEGPAPAGNTAGGLRTGGPTMTTGGPAMTGGPNGKRPPGPPSGGSMTPPAGMMTPPPAGSMTPPAGMMMMPRMMMGSGAYGGGSGRMIFGGPREGDRGGSRSTGVAGTSTARTVDNARLVELSIYAIASLYDRFPPRPKDTKSPEAAPADAKK